MIPIFHQSGKIIGFGGRIIGKDDPAKYLNSPETILYKAILVWYTHIQGPHKKGGICCSG